MSTAVTHPTRLRFTRADYYRMADVGIIAADARVELLDGEIIRMSPIGPTHSSVVTQLDRVFQAAIGDRATCRVQLPLALDEHSEPEPDTALVSPRDDFYRKQHPTADDALLVIEVADTSATLDLGQKVRLYATAGVPEYWVFDLARSVLVVHRDPADGRFADISELDRTSTAVALALPDVSVELRRLL